mmetsp:Transcript_49564/g.92862  ORF Transcript_49564/g.92862 Transcript_49564/m.92862 type:complete len:225 (+) Transcript_49564:1768-2442(+)
MSLSRALLSSAAKTSRRPTRSPVAAADSSAWRRDSCAALREVARSSAATTSSRERSDFTASSEFRRTDTSEVVADSEVDRDSFKGENCTDCNAAAVRLEVACRSSSCPVIASMRALRMFASKPRFSTSSARLCASCLLLRSKASRVSTRCFAKEASNVQRAASNSCRSFCSVARTADETSSMPQPRSFALRMMTWCNACTSSLEWACNCTFSASAVRSLRKSLI